MRQYHPTRGRHIGDAVMSVFVRAGLTPSTYLLTTTGRKTGKQLTHPVTVVNRDGRRWLVATVGETLSLISHTLSLRPGDVLATGTPAGVGYARKPPRLLRPGDTVEVEVERLGVLRNTMVGNHHRSAAGAT